MIMICKVVKVVASRKHIIIKPVPYTKPHDDTHDNEISRKATPRSNKNAGPLGLLFDYCASYLDRRAGTILMFNENI